MEAASVGRHEQQVGDPHISAVRLAISQCPVIRRDESRE
jgi:hypothetical protein